MKIAGFSRKHPKDRACLADAALAPFLAGSVDAVICTFVAHHLPDELLERVLSESSRILSPTGVFVFVDPVWSPYRWTGRLLWKYDRGAFPRTAQKLQQMISECFQIIRQEKFAIWHEYWTCIARPDKTGRVSGENTLMHRSEPMAWRR